MKKAIVPLGIIVLLIFGVFMYVNRFTLFHTVEVEGIVFDSTDLTTNLTGGVTKESNKITYKNIKINDNIYKSGKKYYIGEESKKNVVIDYPIIANDSSSVLILSETGNFVDEKFNKTTTYKNTIISEGTLYNGVDYSKADDAKYIFVESGNGIYTNLMDIEIIQAKKEHKIPTHSFIYFEHSFLRYYFEDHGKYRFEEIVAIQDTEQILINGQKYEYYDFLIMLGVLEPKTDKYDPEPEVKPEDEEPEQGTLDSTTDADSIQLPPPQDTSGGANLVDKEYVKPVVKVSNISSGVYSFKGLLDVYDPAKRIYKAPTFEFYLGENLYMRTSYSKTVNFVTTGLAPNSEYTVKCYYNYKDEYNQKRKGTCLEDTIIKTKDTSELETLQLSLGKIKPNIKSVNIKDIHFKNKSDSEALYGLKQGFIKFENGSTIKLTFGDINELANGGTIEYDSGNILDSGTVYKGRFEFTDIVGNVMKVSGNKIEFETLKSPPTAELDVKPANRNFTTANVSVRLANIDKVDANSYKFVVYETKTQKQVNLVSLDPPEKIDYYQEKEIYNLKPETAYTIKVFCNYQGSDGKWVYNYEMATQDIYTADFTTLGAVVTTINVSAITSSSANVEIRFPQFNSEEAVYQLMEETVPIRISVLDEDGEVETSYTLTQYTKTMLKQGISFNLPESGTLESNTVHRIEVLPYVEVGLADGAEIFPLETSPANKEFKTLKQTPEIYIANGYLADKYIDFDICLQDLDGAILSQTVEVNFIDTSTNETRATHKIKPLTSCTAPAAQTEDEIVSEYAAFTRITDTSLPATKPYRIEVKYGEYQLTDNRKDKETNVKIYPLENEVVQPAGTTGSFELLGLTNDVNYDLARMEEADSNDLSGVNLFDITNNSRWIYKGYNATEMTQKIKIDAKAIEFTSTSGYKAFSYYIPELKNKSYTISYKYHMDTSSNSSKKGSAYVVFSDDAVNMGKLDSSFTNKSLITNTSTGKDATTKEDKYVSQKVTVYGNDGGYSDRKVQNGNYITFYLDVPQGAGEQTKLIIKDLKIEINHVSSPTYSGFGTSSNTEHVSTFAGDFDVKFKELIDSTKALKYKYPAQFFDTAWLYKYYVKFYIDGIEQDSVDTSDLSGGLTDDINRNIVKRYLEANKSIEARLGVQVEYSAGVIKNHDLKTIEFSTEAETRTLTTANEFKVMHPSGYYIVDLKASYCSDMPDVPNCIDMTNVSYPQNFQGSLDFQGQAVLIQNSNSGSSGSVFAKIGGGGIIKNIDLYYLYYEADPYKNMTYSTKRLIGENNGTIKNVAAKFKATTTIQPKSIKIVKEDYYVEEQKQKKDEDGNLMYDEYTGQPIMETVTVKKQREVPKYFSDTGISDFSFVAATNNGIIENFAIRLESKIPILKNFGAVTVTNNGIIRNGYVAGKNVESGYYNGNAVKNIGAIAGTTGANSKISNVYSLIDITFNFKQYEDSYKPVYRYPTDNKDYELTQNPAVLPNEEQSLEKNPNDRIAGNITSSATSALIENAIAVDPRYMFSGADYSYTTSNRVLTKDPLIPSIDANSNVNNVFYIGKESFASATNLASDLVVTGTLRAPGFMESTLNEDKMYNITQSGLLGEFPILEWPAYMPTQTRVKLPSADAKATDFNITAVKNVHQKDQLSEAEQKQGYVAKIEFEIYNPRELQLQNITFDGLEIDRSRGGNKGPYDQLSGNSDFISYFTIYVTKITKYQTSYKLKDIVLAIDNKSGNMSCSAGNLAYFDCDNIENKSYDLDLYLYVDSYQAINNAIDAGHNNLRLSKDIDEKIGFTYTYDGEGKVTSETENPLKIKDSTAGFTGVIDGNGHTIKEIESNNCFIKKLGKGGTIKNLKIDKYTVKYNPGGTYGNYGGLVCMAETGSKIDNVHIGGSAAYNANEPTYVTIAHGSSGNTYIGGFAGTANGLTISNSSISQITYKDLNAKDAEGNRTITEAERNIKNGSLYIGGMVGTMDNTDIKNSFIRNVNFKVVSYVPADPTYDNAVYGFENIQAIGGIAGKVNSGTIENVYATGTIDSKRGNGYGYMGGIIGENNGTLRNAVSKVNVYSDSDNLGGVIGKTSEGSSKAMQTLALGDLLTGLQSYNNVDRTSGTRISNNKNFAWNKQLINSKIDANTNLEELLAEEDLRNTSVYQTKLGFNADDFALNFDKTTKNDDYYMVVLDEAGNRYLSKQDDIKTLTAEDGSLYEAIYVTKDGETTEVVVAKKAGTIPRLRHTDTGELLPNQNYETDYRDVKIEFVEKFSLASEPEYDYCVWDDANKKDVCEQQPWDAEYVKLKFDLEVKDTAIDLGSLDFTITDMHLFDPNKKAKITNHGMGFPVTVNVDVVADDNKNYDSFNIEQIRYKLAPDQNGYEDPNEYSYPTKIKMVIPFYGRIDDLQTWQGIKPGTYQNYSLAADLDFSQLEAGQTPNVELSFNKLMGLHPTQEEIDNGLVADEKNYSIYNLTTNKNSIIKGVTTEIRTVNFGAIFEDPARAEEGYINIETTSTYRVGVIQSLSGKLYGYNDSATLSYDVGFYNVNVYAPNADQVGMIAHNNSSNINEIDMENITVNGKSNVGGLIGYSELKDKYNITARNIHVTGNGNYVGGIIGQDKISGSRIYINNVTVEGLKVRNNGGNYTGGAFGKGVATNVSVIGRGDPRATNEEDRNYVIGKTYVGGIYGTSQGHSNFSYSTAENLYIRGNYGSYVGGVAGLSGGNSYAISRNNYIYSTCGMVGGLYGRTYNAMKYQYVIGVTINGCYSVGGITGYNASTMEYSQVGPLKDAEGNTLQHTTINARGHTVGGIAGYQGAATVRYNVVQATVTADDHTAGGLIGRVENTGTGVTPSQVSIQHNIVANCIVQAKGNPTTSLAVPKHGEGTKTDNTSVSTFDTETKGFYFVGGLVGRFYRNFRSDSGIQSNMINVDVLAGNGNTDATSQYGVGYVFGGSQYYYKNKSTVKETYIDEEGVTKTRNVAYYSTYDWTTPHGDTYINKSVNGKSESYTKQNRLHLYSTLNKVTYDKVSTNKIEELNYLYSTVYSKIKDTLIKVQDADVKNMASYSSSYFKMSGKDTNVNSMQYYPYPNAGHKEVTNIRIDEWPAARLEQRYTEEAYAAAPIYNQSSEFHMLPDFEVYASDVDKINIEFKHTDPNTFFVVNGKAYYVNQTTFTFYYDFKEDFEISVGDGVNSKTIKVSADEVKNGVQVIGEYYYKLDDGEVITNQPKTIVEYEEKEEDVVENIPVEEEIIEDIIENQKENSEEITEEENQVAYVTSPSVALLSNKKILKETKQVLTSDDSNKLVENATNIYGEQILLDNQDIYDITTGKIKENSFENLTLAETKPLHTFDYNDQKIETYLNYSIVNGQKVNKQIYVKNGQVEVIEQGVKNDKSQVFVQNYNDLSFVIYLGEDGKIYSLKDSISFPKNFKNINIKSISTSMTKNTDNLLVEYKDGSYVAFNYRTGQVISEFKDKNVDLIDYIKDYIEISTDKAKVTSTNKSYEEAKALVSKLNKKSINQVLKGDDAGQSAPELYSRKYSIVYNPTTDKYDVYEMPAKSQTGQKSLAKALSTTVDSIIDSNPVLVKYYRNNEGAKINKVSAIFITIGVVIGIIAATVLVGRYYKKVRKQRA